jgi:hypothetical protein
VDHLGRGTALCVSTASMAEGKRFGVLFRRHLQEEVSSGFVGHGVVRSFFVLCEFSCTVLGCHDGDILNSLLS